MSCSKLGNLPELTYEVIKYLQNDYSTLHSCVLVNRLWDNSSPIDNLVLQVINLHQNLKKVILSYYNLPFYQSLLLSNDYNCSNTLNIITLYNVNFEGIIYLNKIFEQLNVLESVHIIHCLSLNTSFIQQILNLTKPFKLKSLFINVSSNIDESLLLLLQKSGGTFIKKLLIRDSIRKANYDLLPYIKKNIMKEKRVKYLNFRNFNKELFDYRDIVKEFKSHNIIVQKYNDLHFDIYQFMRKLD
ncbi:hypothetical protein RhiirA1_541361 [Rhizophagus irregularis]|uniref:F-box domain-containing protein n=1 Tax=Rhizophagus irregularis TaxID=588596 RepID=A0A2N0R3N5_9GLOM|nr:hypothetical protein RhiirA1_541361 [Rhizophagus irregularis]